jgi:hypothetical protein
MIHKTIQDIPFYIVEIQSHLYKVCIGSRLLTIGYAHSIREAEEAVIGHFLSCPLALQGFEEYLSKQEHLFYNK